MSQFTQTASPPLPFASALLEGQLPAISAYPFDPTIEAAEAPLQSALVEGQLPAIFL